MKPWKVCWRKHCFCPVVTLSMYLVVGQSFCWLVFSVHLYSQEVFGTFELFEGSLFQLWNCCGWSPLALTLRNLCLFLISRTVRQPFSQPFQYRSKRAGTFQYRMSLSVEALMKAVEHVLVTGEPRGDPKRKRKSIGTETGACRLSRLSLKDMEDSHSPPFCDQQWSTISRSWLWWSVICDQVQKCWSEHLY